MQLDGYMTVREAMEVLGVGKSRVHQLIASGALRAHKFGNGYAIDASDVIRRKVEPVRSGRPRKG